jgi:pimeloyl-ACP methyl ester carboxylesterase
MVFQRKWTSLAEAVDEMHAFNPRRTREAVEVRMKQQLRETETGEWMWNTDPSIVNDASARASELPEVMWQKVRELTMPVLFVRGAQSDVVQPESAKKFVEMIRQSPSAGTAIFAEVPKAGHSVAGDNPAGFMEAIRPFLPESLSKL